MAAWVLTTLSPNKGDRYIAPMLPALLLMLARGWWQWGHWLQARHSSLVWPLFGAGLFACVPAGWDHLLHRFEDRPRGPVEALVEAAGGADHRTPPATLTVVPSTSDLNQHNVSFYGRAMGGRPLAASWGAAAVTRACVSAGGMGGVGGGNQGSVRKAARQLQRCAAAVCSSW